MKIDRINKVNSFSTKVIIEISEKYKIIIDNKEIMSIILHNEFTKLN